MAAYTYANAVQFLKDFNVSSSSALQVRQYARIINAANEALHSGRWPFDKRIGYVTLAALYSTGTVAVTSGGTTVTLTTGVVASTHVGRWIRFAGESVLYRITAANTGANTWTIDRAYEGSANLTAATYELTDDLITPPTGARLIGKIIRSQYGKPLYQKIIDDVQWLRCHRREVSYPTVWAPYWTETSGTPALTGLLVYPSPSVKLSLTIPYYEFPSELSADADIFQIPDTAKIKALLQEYLHAFLYQEQGKQAEHMAQLQKAEALAIACRSDYEPGMDTGQAAEWSPEIEEGNACSFYPRAEVDA